MYRILLLPNIGLVCLIHKSLEYCWPPAQGVLPVSVYAPARSNCYCTLNARLVFRSLAGFPSLDLPSSVPPTPKPNQLSNKSKLRRQRLRKVGTSDVSQTEPIDPLRPMYGGKNVKTRPTAPVPITSQSTQTGPEAPLGADRSVGYCCVPTAPRTLVGSSISTKIRVAFHRVRYCNKVVSNA